MGMMMEYDGKGSIGLKPIGFSGFKDEIDDTEERGLRYWFCMREI